MTKERILEIRELLFHLERKIKPLEWDASRNQINQFKKKQLVALREQHGTLSEELNGLNQ
ncbi:hypothetical protein HOD05_04110 [Candidatus Woesearchaeota archaeon]|jgi:hypothetical protein|nr:hypothetical protein [Candidatus Woesearchaeota archaeon]MBT4151222.1 hypothetical protein [Candidatus Woesearchaeota archaeon]MBT4247656.1 hypothetical protein [Candidatus Woesearchaeota archaeon]MBT4434379.1 hypothetical protein [Candidatus Woesearchaeota archaeon]MBT7331742.1 hypothetical protein [Candidatus Woesearchaeota archaeon]